MTDEKNQPRAMSRTQAWILAAILSGPLWGMGLFMLVIMSTLSTHSPESLNNLEEPPAIFYAAAFIWAITLLLWPIGAGLCAWWIRRNREPRGGLFWLVVISSAFLCIGFPVGTFFGGAALLWAVGARHSFWPPPDEEPALSATPRKGIR